LDFFGLKTNHLATLIAAWRLEIVEVWETAIGWFFSEKKTFLETGTKDETFNDWDSNWERWHTDLRIVQKHIPRKQKN
jgi:hypothetical protein